MKIFGRFVGKFRLEILRCCSESVLMKVSYMHIHREDYVMRFKKNSLCRAVPEIYGKALKVKLRIKLHFHR